MVHRCLLHSPSLVRPNVGMCDLMLVFYMEDVCSQFLIKYVSQFFFFVEVGLPDRRAEHASGERTD